MQDVCTRLACLAPACGFFGGGVHQNGDFPSTGVLQSIFAPEALTAWAQRGISAARNCVNSSLPIKAGSAPCVTMRLRMSGLLITCLKASLSLAVTSLGM